MTFIPGQSPDDGRSASPALLVLADWYAAHSSVRRLWAIRESQRLRIVVSLEPSLDNDDVYPAWLANGHQWTHELQMRLDEPVQLQVINEPILNELAAGIDGVLFAELFWRDSSVPP
jgi:hypothetical protein